MGSFAGDGAGVEGSWGMLLLSGIRDWYVTAQSEKLVPRPGWDDNPGGVATEARADFCSDCEKGCGFPRKWLFTMH
jgi:hypothetical protein